MKNTEDKSHPSEPVKKSYTRPVLVKYGSVNELTAGGSGAIGEGEGGPGSSDDPSFHT